MTDAALAYVDTFTAHVNVGFFRGAELADPHGLLEGTGKLMRHVKIRPGTALDAVALSNLIDAAYADMKKRVHAGKAGDASTPSAGAARFGTASRPARR